MAVTMMSVIVCRVTVCARRRGVTDRGVVEGNVGVSVSVGACSVEMEASGIVPAVLGVTAMTARRAHDGHENQTGAANDEE